MEAEKVNQPPADVSVDAVEQPITKPKRKNVVSEETRKKMADNMRKVNQARIDKARLANEAILEEKERKVAERFERIQEKKAKIQALKEAPKAPSTSDSSPAAAPQEEPKTPKRKVKKVIVQESSDSEDYAEEVVYVQKAAKPKASAMTKPKVSKAAPPEEPKCIYRFV